MSCHGNRGQKKDKHKSGKHSNNSHSDKGHGISPHTLHLIMMLILVGILIYNAFIK